MNIKIYKLEKELEIGYETGKGNYQKEHIKRVPAFEVEIEDAEIITMVRRVLSKGVVPKE